MELTIQTIVDLCLGAFSSLQASISMQRLEALAIMIHKAMSARARYFHTMEHVFSLTDASSPLQSLAALFHDIVYYQVDKGFFPQVYETVAPYIEIKADQVFITETVEPDDRFFQLTLDVFGFEPGQALSPYAGLNEFLSALFMNKALEDVVQEKDLLKITVLIEATISFREQSHFDVLTERLTAIGETYPFSLSASEIKETVQLATTFSNADVGSFAYSDAGLFLDATWKLLPETNLALRLGQVYSVKDYREAIQKMEGFFGSLDPDNVFHQYKSVPPDTEFRHMVQLAHQNTCIAREYLGVKLLAQAVLEALAELTGGDAPLSLFMGAVRQAGEQVVRLEDFLPSVPAASDVDPDSTIYKLLATGRANESSFDMKDSPLSLFLYKSLGPDKARRSLTSAKDMFAAKLEAKAFLQTLPVDTVFAIIKAWASIAVTRREALLQLANPD